MCSAAVVRRLKSLPHPTPRRAQFSLPHNNLQQNKQPREDSNDSNITTGGGDARRDILLECPPWRTKHGLVILRRSECSAWYLTRFMNETHSDFGGRTLTVQATITFVQWFNLKQYVLAFCVCHALHTCCTYLSEESTQESCVPPVVDSETVS